MFLSLPTALRVTHHMHYGGFRLSAEYGSLFKAEYCDLMALPSESMAYPMGLIVLHSIAMEIIAMVTHGAL